MGVPNRQIGWNDKTNMLWNVLKELNALRGEVSNITTTSSTTTQPVKYLEFEIDSDGTNYVDFDFNWSLVGGINTITVDWGDSTIDVATVSGVNTDTFTHTYTTIGQYVVTLSFPVPVSVLSYEFYMNSDNVPITYFNDGNIDFSYIQMYTKNPTFNINLSSSTSLSSLYLRGYALSPAPYIFAIDLTQQSNLQYLDIGNVEFDDGIYFPAVGALVGVFIDDIRPVDGALENIIVGVDNLGTVNGRIDSYTSGTLSGAGLIAEANLISKGWIVVINP